MVRLSPTRPPGPNVPGSVCAVNEQGTPQAPEGDSFEALFRDEPSPTVNAPSDEPPDSAAHAPDHTDGAPAPTARPDLVDTGRLFRSHRVEGHFDAVPAITPSHAQRLRTLASAPVDAEPAPAAVLLAEPERTDESAPAVARRSIPALRLGGSMSALGITIVVGGAALLFGLIDAVVFGPGLGWLTGIALVLASVVAAVRVRLDTAPSAIFAPPLAFSVAAVTVGQIGQPVASGMLSRAVVIFFELAENWLWIIGATIAALVIVVARTRQSR